MGKIDPYRIIFDPAYWPTQRNDIIRQAKELGMDSPIKSVKIGGKFFPERIFEPNEFVIVDREIVDSTEDQTDYSESSKKA